MNKRSFFIAALLTIFVVFPVFAANQPLPNALTTPVSVDTGPAGMPLDAVLRSMVQSIGWVAMTRDVPDENVVIRMPKTPFIDAWRLVFSLYASDLAYAALPGGVMVVGPEDVVAGRFPKAIVTNAKPASKAKPVSLQTIKLNDSDEKALARAAKLFPPSVTYAIFPDKQLLAVKADPDSITQIKHVLEVAGLISSKKPAAVAPKLPRVLNVPSLPDDVLQTLRESFPTATLKYVSSSRKLVVNGLSDDEIASLQKMISELLAPAAAPASAKEDTDQSKPDLPENRVYKLSYIAPDDAARIIDFVAPSAKVLVVKGVHNAIWVKAPSKLQALIAENLAHYEDLARGEKESAKKENEVATNDSPKTIVATLPLEGRNPDEVISALSKTFPNASLVKAGDNLIVKASPEDLQSIKELLSQLKAPKKEEGHTDAENSAQKTASAQPEARSHYRTDYAAPDKLILLARSTGQFPKDLKALVDERTGEIILVGTEGDISKALSLFKELDKPVPQVELRVQIHQVDSSTARRLGIDLNAILAPFSMAIGTGGLQLGYELGSSAANALTAALDTLESKGAAKALVNTRFLVQDDKPVKLKSGGKLTVLTSTASGGSGEGKSKPTPISVNYGLEVELTPEIALNDDAVTVAIKTNLGGRPVEGAGGTIDIPQKSFEDYVRIKNGKSVVLGGLITTTKSSTETSSPLVSWIPLIGDLFTQHNDSESSSELLIVVSANIVSSAPAKEEAREEEPVTNNEVTSKSVEPANEKAAVKDEQTETDSSPAATPSPAKSDAAKPQQASASVDNDSTEPPTSVDTGGETKPEANASSSEQPANTEAETGKANTGGGIAGRAGLTVGEAQIPYPHDPLPAYAVFSLRAAPGPQAEYGFSLVLPASSERLCLAGIRILDGAGRVVTGHLRSRSTSGPRACAEPGGMVVGEIRLPNGRAASHVDFVFESDDGEAYVVSRTLE